MFQAASNFNGVEAICETSYPDRAKFITEYADDNTQGPAASISAGPGAISRVLLPFYDPSKPAAEWRQTKTQQMEMLGDVKEYFSVMNGYVVQKGDEKKVEADLLNEENRAIVDKVKVCVHVDEEVVFGLRDSSWFGYNIVGYKPPISENSENIPENDPSKKITEQNHKICQVFCAAMNMGQGDSGAKNAELEGDGTKAKLLLEAAYRGTYLAAIRHGCQVLYLTLIGGGVFGNSPNTILDVIGKVHLDIACREMNDVIEEVHLVLYNMPPVTTTFLNSLKDKGVETEIHAFKNCQGTIYTNF